MPGFSNGIVYADNVRFDGGHYPGEVTTDGQLLIGSTAAPNIKVSVPTGSNGITVTTGSGTLDFSTSGTFAQQQIFYVGKHGNDANSGTNINTAVLTFGQALTLASAAIPSAVNRFSIVCLDDGIYAENITTVPFVDIFAPNATLSGTITVDDNSNIKFFALNVATATIGITKPAGSTYSNVEIEVITIAGTGNGCTCSTGFLNLTWKQMYVVDGYGIGDLSVGLGHIHIKGGEIYISGTGIGSIRANTGSTVGHVDHMLDTGGGTGSAIIVYDGTIDVSVNKIDVSNAYQVQGASSVLNLFCNELIGTRLSSLGGTPNIWTPVLEMANGQLVIGSTGVNPVVTTLTAGIGVGITNAAGSITISSSGGGFSWNEVTSATNPNALVASNGYIAKGAGVVQFILPATAAVGDMFRIVGYGNLWTLKQNALQSITLESNTSTVGILGSITATNIRDCVNIICVVANTEFQIIDSIGNITFA